MGVAILMVIVCHAACCNLPMGVFTQVANYGLIGVDIFMLYSAYGLCYSYNKHRISEFYARRYIRVVPLYLILVCEALVRNTLSGGGMTNAIGALSTSFFWGVGDIFVDWYLTAMLYIYLLFPLFYNIISKFGLIAYITLAISFLLVAWYLPTTWFQDSALCRMPIFLAGIVIYVAKKKSLAISFLLSFFLLLTCFSYFSGKVCLTYYMAPFVICLLIFFVSVTNKVIRTKPVLEFIGKYTLELYVANCIVMRLVAQISSTIERYVVYYGLILLLAFFFGLLNERVQRYFAYGTIR